MGQITSSVGLVSGIPIQDTVDKLVALQAKPRDNLVNLNTTLQQQQTALTQLTVMLTSLQLSAQRLSSATLYDQLSATSASPTVLGAAVTGQPAPGTYSFVPVRMVQSQQFTSSKLASDASPLGAGNLSFRFGGFLDKAASLDLLNGGTGFERGKIRITDRSGASAEIDLNYARTIDDVLSAINGNSAIAVRAEAHGDKLRLIDETGKTVSNLRVEEVDGATASSLGLSGIDVAANQVDGADLLRLFDSLSLDQLNQGNGIRFDDALSDLKITFRDGTQANVDFKKLAIVGTPAEGTTQGVQGPSARVTFKALQNGAAYLGAKVVFENDDSIAKGNESVAYDSQTRTLWFKIDEGNSTGTDVIAALARNPEASKLFIASGGAGGDGSGIISTSDTATIEGPRAIAATSAVNNEARLVFTAVHGGPDYDGVTVRFENANIQPGQESVTYDASAKELVFQIAQGQTKANDIIALLNGDPVAGSVFTAASATGSNGNGLIDSRDSGAVTAGGAIVEPVAGTNEQSIGDLLATLNAVDPAKLRAEIAADGERIMLTDLTSGGGVFNLADLNASHAAEDLGLVGDAQANTATGRRLLSGLKTSLLSQLDGGKGFAGLGVLQLTDRSGASAAVDLASAETLDDALDAINAAGIGVSAKVDKNRAGIRLSDTTGAAGNLVVANGDGTNTATRLGLVINSAVSEVSSGNLKLRTIDENSLLAKLNPGGRVSEGSFDLTDTNGVFRTIRLTPAIKTVGDLLDEVNRQAFGIQARINDAGDGIVLVDTVHGTSELKVAERSGATASELHLLRGVVHQNIGGEDTQTVEGSSTIQIKLGETETLRDLVTKINDSKSGVRADVFNDGSLVRPFRFTLTSQVPGTAGELLVDASQFDFTLDETTKAQDALLEFKAPGGGQGLLASSSTNTFKDVLAGVSLDIKAASADPVTVTVAPSNSSLSSTILAIVDSYNKIVTKVQELTAFDTATNKSAILQGDGALLRIENDLGRLVTSRYFGLGDVQTLQALGIKVKSDGTLDLNKDALDAKLAADPEGVKKFFTQEKTGFAAKLNKMLEQLAGPKNSLLVNRNDALARKLETNNAKVNAYNVHLDAVRQRMLLQFYQSELAISKIRDSLNAISSIAYIGPVK